MQPIPTNLGWTTHKPNSTGTANGVSPGFNTQLQALLQKSHPPTLDGGPSRGSIGHLHPGGMNESAQRLLRLGGKG